MSRPLATSTPCLTQMAGWLCRRERRTNVARVEAPVADVPSVDSDRKLVSDGSDSSGSALPVASASAASAAPREHPRNKRRRWIRRGEVSGVVSAIRSRGAAAAGVAQ